MQWKGNFLAALCWPVLSRKTSSSWAHPHPQDQVGTCTTQLILKDESWSGHTGNTYYILFLWKYAKTCYWLSYIRQVLSESVSKALTMTGGGSVEETAKFVGLMDKYFDCMNVHNFTHGVHARKQFQMPYRSSKDLRIQVLQTRVADVVYHLWPVMSLLGSGCKRCSWHTLIIGRSLWKRGLGSQRRKKGSCC